MLSPIIVGLNRQTFITIKFNKSLNVDKLLKNICEMSGIEDSSYFGLFINPEIGNNDFWLDRNKSLAEQITEEHEGKPIPLYLRICFYVRSPQDIDDYNAKVFFAYGLRSLIDFHKNEIGVDEFSLMDDTFKHGLELGGYQSSDINDLPPIVTLNSFMLRISQSKFYLDGTFFFECIDKYSGLMSEAAIGCLGIKFKRGDINLCVSWTKFEKISFKSTLVKMQVKSDKSISTPTQYFLLEFSNVFEAKSFWRVCTESHNFFSNNSTPPKKPVSDFRKFSYLTKNMNIEHVAISFVNDSYNFSLSGGFESCLPFYVSRVKNDLSSRLSIGSAVVFINEKCTFPMSLEDVENILKCLSVSKSTIKLGIIRDFIQFGKSEATISCRCEQVINSFINLMDLALKNHVYFDRIKLLVPKLYANLSSLTSINYLEVSIEQLREDVNSPEIRRQYNSIPRVWPGMTMKVSSLPNFRHLNRYRDTVPYDQNLTSLSGGSGYINASPVEYNKHDVNLKFIASQGPMDFTSADLYQLIWEKKINIIIMVTGLVEKGVEKCYRYWPELGKTVSYSFFDVKTLSEENCGVFISSVLEITHSSEEESLMVKHLRYTNWPDHGVPSDFESFYGFILFLNDLLNDSASTKTPLVHCSAGVGRTGVVMVSLIILRLIMTKSPVVPAKIVETMRQFRTLLVQTLEQYYFICKLALHIYDSSLILRQNDL